MADAWGSAWGKHKNYGAFQVVTMATSFCDVCTESASESVKSEFIINIEDAQPHTNIYSLISDVLYLMLSLVTLANITTGVVNGKSY
jgi:hypothetical protein